MVDTDLKTCTVCHKNKPILSFSERKERTKNGKPTQYSSHCKECHREYAKKSYYKYHKKNKDRSRQYRAKKRMINKELLNKQRRDWAKKNKEYEQLRSWVRNKRVKKAIPKWADKKYIELWYKMAKIESVRTGRNVEVDHIIPISSDNVCGLHCEDNMQLLFAEDNRRKSNHYEIS